MSLFLCLLLLILFVFGMPVAFALAVASAAYITYLGLPLGVVTQKMVFGIKSFTLLAIPMFILTANLMSAAGIADRMFKFAKNLVGHIKGGLAHANIVASIIFAGMSGAALADVAGLGRMEIEAMVKNKFDPDFAAAVTAASSIVGPIIPPSVAAVIFGAVSGTSIGKLLIGGIIPGILLGILLIGVTYLIAVKNNFPSEPRVPFKELFISFKKAGLALIAPLILIGGILSGVFTPTESAAIAALYSFILGVVIYRTITFKILLKTLLNSAIGTAMITFIFSSSMVFSWVITIENFPHMVGVYLSSITQDPNLMLLIINVALLCIGCLMEMGPLLIILPPIFLPILLKLGVDPIHFGVVMVLNIAIGLFTPPFGLGMFILLDITKRPMIGFAKHFAPYLGILIFFLLVLTYCEQIVLFLPNLIM